MLGMGIGVAITGIALFGIGGLFGPDWEKRQVDRYLQRHGGAGTNEKESARSDRTTQAGPEGFLTTDGYGLADRR
jgi:hypothetical protein